MRKPLAVLLAVATLISAGTLPAAAVTHPVAGRGSAHPVMLPPTPANNASAASSLPPPRPRRPARPTRALGRSAPMATATNPVTGNQGFSVFVKGNAARNSGSTGVATLTFTQSTDVSSAAAGSVVHYTITVANSGGSDYVGAAFTEPLAGVLDDAAYNNGAAAPAGTTVAYTAPNLTWTGTVPARRSVTITFSVTVHNPDTGNKILASTLTGPAGSNCPTGSTAAAPCGTSIAVLTPALSITQASKATSAVPGQQVTFTVTIIDTGQTPDTDVSVTDTLLSLDDAVYGNDAVPSAGSVRYTSPVLTWTGDLTPKQVVTITYSVTVNDPDTGDKPLAASAASTEAGSSCPPASGNPGCDIAIPVLTPALTITKTASTATATPGQQVTYTITVTGSGQTTYTGASLTDNLAGVIDDAAYNDDATATSGDLSSGTLSYASPVLTWTGDLTVGQTVTITYTATVNNPDTGSHVLANTVTSATSGSNCASGSTDPRCTTTVNVTALTITNTADVSSTTPGSAVAYTITITDSGSLPYEGATVTDPLTGALDDATYNAAATPTTGTVTYTRRDLTWTGDLIPGQTATITFTVNTPDTGDKHMVSTVTSTSVGSTCPPGAANPACTATVTDLIPALTITKTATVATATPGSAVGYTVTVTDTGQTPYSAAVVTDDLSGVLADAAYAGGATATIGSLSYASPVLTWTGDLIPGETATIAYTVTINNPDTGGRALSNTAVSAAPGSTCPAGTTSLACTATVAIAAGPLFITAPATADLRSAAPGGTLTGGLGTVQVTDDRGFGANWTATVTATSFATGTATPAETIPVSDATYHITALDTSTGPGTFTPVSTTQLSTSPQPVVSAANVTGNTTVTWRPTINVTVPPSAIAGPYTATITHSVS